LQRIGETARINDILYRHCGYA